MTAYILRRIAQVVPVLIGVSILAFLMSHLVPGDPVSVMLGQSGTAEDVERLREELGLNDPIYVQYGRFVGNALQGDLGRPG
jgi:peptide/nickel transport system permease protein